jgi:hypothetical protein
MASTCFPLSSSILAFTVLALSAGCGDDTGGSTTGSGGATGTGGGSTSTGDSSTSTGDGSTSGSGGAGTGGGEDDCSPIINGTLDAPNGAATVTLGGDANVEVAEPGEIPCNVRFDPLSGISNGDGTASGATYFECRAGEGDLYYGFLAIMFGAPEAGATYPLGVAQSVSAGDGTFEWNGEASFAYEEGPQCEPTTGLAKVWDGEVSAGESPATGSLVIQSLEGNAISFSIEGASVPVSAVQNDAGTGTIEVDAEGEAEMAGL